MLKSSNPSNSRKKDTYNRGVYKKKGILRFGEFLRVLCGNCMLCETRGNMVCELDFLWLGMRDSNPRIPDSESGALPLGESPVFVAVIIEKESQKSNFYFL